MRLERRAWQGPNNLGQNAKHGTVHFSWLLSHKIRLSTWKENINKRPIYFHMKTKSYSIKIPRNADMARKSFMPISTASSLVCLPIPWA